TAITPQVDAQSRTVLVRAQLANPDHALVPGAFARVTTSYDTAKATVVVPRVAVQYATSGNSIWLAVRDAKSNALHAHQQGIRTGQSRGDLVEVVSGLKSGE
ncbi:efflux RND transporter periplasmic adaptor subunit, partial [Acetobacter tropicalis]